MSDKPYLSIVVTSRNDNHGGDLQKRMQIFVTGLLEQCKKYNLPAELIVVEWNPPPDKPPLLHALNWHVEGSPCTVRIIQVSPKLHFELAHADKIQLFQMIAKNVGILRASGQFILATNIDIILSDELMQFLAQKQLLENKFYRIDRYDVSANIPFPAVFQKQLEFCADNILRVCTANGTLTWPIEAVATGADPILGDTATPIAEATIPTLVDPSESVANNVARKDVVVSLSEWLAASPSQRPLSKRPASVETVIWLRRLWYAYQSKVDNKTKSIISRLMPNFLKKMLFSQSFIWFVGSPRQKIVQICTRQYLLAKSFISTLDMRFSVWVKQLEIFQIGKSSHNAESPLLIKQIQKLCSRRFSQVDAVVNFTQLPAYTHEDIPGLHTNGCGDFTLASKKLWHSLHGYPEWPIFSFHIDSVLCHSFKQFGADEIVLADPMRIYHIEHGSGWTPEADKHLFTGLSKRDIPYLTYPELVQIVKEICDGQRSPVNADKWGFNDRQLEEIQISPESNFSAAIQPAASCQTI